MLEGILHQAGKVQQHEDNETFCQDSTIGKAVSYKVSVPYVHENREVSQ